MEKIVITITGLGNSAFSDEEAGFSQERELYRILSSIAEKFKRGEEPVSHYDINGNKVCTIEYE